MMARLFSRIPSGACRHLTRSQLLVLCMCIFFGLIYFAWGRRTATARYLPAPPAVQGNGKGAEGEEEEQKRLPAMTLWGAPLVWGDSDASTWQRIQMSQRRFRVGLVLLAVGRYVRFLQRLLSSAEVHFLPRVSVTYYILTDSPRVLHPAPALGSRRELKVVSVAELPGWDRLSMRRMGVLTNLLKEQVVWEMDYVFCMDVDQEFTGPVGTEILGKLVATLHPEFYSQPRYTFPFETDPESLAYVVEGEGQYYYTSEFYGGLGPKVLALVQTCSQMMIQDQEKGVRAERLEESYLNRYLIDNRPTCVLSPEYSWWRSSLSVAIPTHRIHSLGRQCMSVGSQKEDSWAC